MRCFTREFTRGAKAGAPGRGDTSHSCTFAACASWHDRHGAESNAAFNAESNAKADTYSNGGSGVGSYCGPDPCFNSGSIFCARAGREARFELQPRDRESL